MIWIIASSRGKYPAVNVILRVKNNAVFKKATVFYSLPAHQMPFPVCYKYKIHPREMSFSIPAFGRCFQNPDRFSDLDATKNIS